MTHKEKVLRLLSDHKPHSHMELYRLGCVAHSRISDLRRDGHQIKAWREDGLYFYKLEAAVTLPAASTGTPSSNPAPLSRDHTASTAHSRDGDGVLTLFAPMGIEPKW